MASVAGEAYAIVPVPGSPLLAAALVLDGSCGWR